MKTALRLARLHLALAFLFPLLALVSLLQWTEATWSVQYYVAVLETALAQLNATRRHDPA